MGWQHNISHDSPQMQQHYFIGFVIFTGTWFTIVCFEWIKCFAWSGSIARFVYTSISANRTGNAGKIFHRRSRNSCALSVFSRRIGCLSTSVSCYVWFEIFWLHMRLSLKIYSQIADIHYLIKRSITFCPFRMIKLYWWPFKVLYKICWQPKIRLSNNYIFYKVAVLVVCGDLLDHLQRFKNKKEKKNVILFYTFFFAVQYDGWIIRAVRKLSGSHGRDLFARRRVSSGAAFT